MPKTILVTGATDGIGRTTARQLAGLGHRVLLHGRSASKLAETKADLLVPFPDADLETYTADLSVLSEVAALVTAIASDHKSLDVLINNAGVFKVPETVTDEGLDVRFAVNTIAPYLLTKLLLPILGDSGRVVNLSSAAQAPLLPQALVSTTNGADSAVYAQSKLALTMWSRHMSEALNARGPSIIAVNPGSFLGSKMVKEAYGVAGDNLEKGADILVRAALSEEFSRASGLYFDNDQGSFASPHPDAADTGKNAAIVEVIETVVARYL